MKRRISLILVCAIMLSLLAGCGAKSAEDSAIAAVSPTAEAVAEKVDAPNEIAAPTGETVAQTQKDAEEQVDGADADAITHSDYKTITPEFSGLNDPELLSYLEDDIYSELVANLNSDKYFVENISTVYVSKEYLEELAYNSKTNIFFGYSLEDLDAQFQGTRYVFTLGSDGKTVVQPFEAYDDIYETILRNVAIGSGVILICVTVSVVSAGVGAPAISMIFAASAKTGAMMALSGGTFGGLASGILKAFETDDWNEILKAAALGGSEGFKWGAISGCIGGGAQEAVALKGATLNGLTMNEAALIQKESGYPLDVIKQFSNMDQYIICKDAGLRPQMIDGHTALVRSIDLDFTDELGRTNLDRMRQGLAALDPATGDPYQLHHIGQKADSTLAILSEAEHMQGGNNQIWHELGKATEVHGAGSTWNAQRQAFWKAMAEALS